MRLGFFGGSFDPPHLGHTAIAYAAADAFALDKLLWTPAGRQPLKQDGAVASFGQRLAMVHLACEADPRFEASTLDAPSPDGSANYTVETLRTLHQRLPEAQIYGLAGADSFGDLGQWRESGALLELAEWIVVSRPGSVLQPPRGMTLDARQSGRVHLLDTVHLDISATTLRRRLRTGQECRDLLAPNVADYIVQHHLYRA